MFKNLWEASTHESEKEQAQGSVEGKARQSEQPLQ